MGEKATRQTNAGAYWASQTLWFGAGLLERTGVFSLHYSLSAACFGGLPLHVRQGAGQPEGQSWHGGRQVEEIRNNTLLRFGTGRNHAQSILDKDGYSLNDLQFSVNREH